MLQRESEQQAVGQVAVQVAEPVLVPAVELVPEQVFVPAVERDAEPAVVQAVERVAEQESVPGFLFPAVFPVLLFLYRA